MHLRAFVLRPLLDLAPPCASPAARPDWLADIHDQPISPL